MANEIPPNSVNRLTAARTVSTATLNQPQPQSPPVADIDSAELEAPATRPSQGLVKTLQEAGLEPGRSYLAQVEKVIPAEQEAKAAQAVLRISTANRFLVETTAALKEGDAVWVKAAEGNRLLVRPPDAPFNGIDPSTLARMISQVMPRQQAPDQVLNLLMQGLATQRLAGFSHQALDQVSKLLASIPNLPLSTTQAREASHLLTTILVKGNLLPWSLREAMTAGTTQPSSSPAETKGANPGIQISPKIPVTDKQLASALASAITTLLKNVSHGEAKPDVVKLTPDLRNALTQLAAPAGKGQTLSPPVLESARQLNAAVTKLVAAVQQQVQGRPDATSQSPQTGMASTARMLDQITNTLLKALPDGAAKLSPASSPQSAATWITAKLPASLQTDTSEFLRQSQGFITEIEKSLAGEVVKSVIQRSGVLTESNLRQVILSQGESAISSRQAQNILWQDLKANLVPLLKILTQSNIPSFGQDAITKLGLLPFPSSTETAPNPSLIASTNPDLLASPFDFPRFVHFQPVKADHKPLEITAGEMLKQLAGALNRVHFNQLNSLYQAQTQSTDTQQVQTWLFDLPVVVDNRETQALQLRLDKETPKDEAKRKKLGSQWKITLGFEFESLGPIQIELRLSKNQLDSHIWARDAKTLRLINQEIPHFRKNLGELGIEVKDILCQHGIPKRKPGPIEHRLVDVHT